MSKLWVPVRRTLVIMGLIVGWLLAAFATSLAVAMITVNLGWESSEPVFGGESAEKALMIGLVGCGAVTLVVLLFLLRRWLLKTDRQWFVPEREARNEH